MARFWSIGCFLVELFYIPSILCQIQRCDNVTNSFGSGMAVGDFKTPGFPRQYCDNLRCSFEVRKMLGVWRFRSKPMVGKPWGFKWSFSTR